MPNIPSMRGVKALERNHAGQNHIVTVKIRNGVKTVETRGVSRVANKVNIHPDLIRFLVLNKTLLWIYSKTKNEETFTFGYDEHIGDGKIGHAALADKATIAGEIRKIDSPYFHSGWAISNESGAWGAMNRDDGKSRMLKDVASKMTVNLGIIVSAERAFSRYGWKRKLQELTRGSTRKLG